MNQQVSARKEMRDEGGQSGHAAQNILDWKHVGGFPVPFSPTPQGLRSAMPDSSKTSGLGNISLVTLGDLVLGDRKSEGLLVHGSSQTNFRKVVSWRSLPRVRSGS